jgi:hypothetical protein
MPTLSERLLGRFARRRRSIFLDEAGNPKTIIGAGKSKGGISMGSSTRSEASLKNFWHYYESEGTVFASINTTAWNAVMVGYVLVSADEKAKLLIQNALEIMDIDAILLDSVIYGLVFGDSFIEKVRSGKNIVKLKTVDPITMQINTDEHGEIVDFQQKIQGQLLPKLSLEEIIHFRFFPKPDGPYGLSLISPSKDTIDRKITTDESIAKAIGRHGTPKYVVKVGDKENIPDKDVFESIKATLEDIEAINEFIIPGTIDITTIDESGIQSVKEYYDYFQTQLIVGLLCPEEALGQGKGSTEATARVKEIMYERFIKAIQHKITTIVRLDVINPILLSNGMDENIVYMKFNSVTDADEAVKAKWLGNLLRGFPEGAQPFSIDEIRAIFDYPPLSKSMSPENQPVQQPDKPSSDKPAPEKPSVEKPKEPEPKLESKVVKGLKSSIEDLKDELDELKEELNDRKNKS